MAQDRDSLDEAADELESTDLSPALGFDDKSDLDSLPVKLRELYEVHSFRNAATILTKSHTTDFRDLRDALMNFRLRKSHLVSTDEEGAEIAIGGGRKSLVASALDSALYSRGWLETLFETEVSVKGTHRAKRSGSRQSKRERQVFSTWDYKAPTHSVDCYKNRVAVEVEWNNKNPFFDRDLNNFRVLFDLRVIDVGVIITRSEELDEVFVELIGKRNARQRYGATTTRMRKLLPLLKGGGGGGCPVLVFGITKKLYDETK